MENKEAMQGNKAQQHYIVINVGNEFQRQIQPRSAKKMYNAIAQVTVWSSHKD